jgi:hypothetical protein
MSRRGVPNRLGTRASRVHSLDHPAVGCAEGNVREAEPISRYAAYWLVEHICNQAELIGAATGGNARSTRDASPSRAPLPRVTIHHPNAVDRRRVGSAAVIGEA